MTEQQLQTRIIQDMGSMGGYVVKVIQGTRAGIPDIIACYRGRFIAIEVKAEGKVASPLQWENFARINKAGGTSYLIDSWERWQEAKKKIGDMG